MTTPNTSTAFETTMRNVTSIGIPLIVVAIGAMFAWMDKIDQRQFDLQGEIVTQQDLNKVEERLVRTVDNRMSNIEKQLEGIVQSQRRLEDKLYKVDK